MAKVSISLSILASTGSRKETNGMEVENARMRVL